VTEVDALDERAVADHVDALAADAGGIDIALNAVSFPHVQGTPVLALTFDEVWHPIDVFGPSRRPTSTPRTSAPPGPPSGSATWRWR
jgi:hypothetical protein